MGFVKVVKNKAYYKRYQVKFRRRREAKTDYYARKRLIWSDKNKYDTPKHRLVVRFSNKDVVCQIVQAGLQGDSVVAAAYGHELARYGLPFNFNNYAATYCTGLLLARKVNAKFKLPYVGLGKGAVEGTYFNIGDFESESNDASGQDATERKPFKAILDVGLKRTTTGSKVFAAVKGACDGGLNVPHSTRRFVGTPKEKDAETDFSKMKERIFGGHVARHMELLKDDQEAYDKQFSRYAKAKLDGKGLEALYKKVHAAIRADKDDDLLKKNRDLNRLGYFKTRSTPKDPKKVYTHDAKYKMQPHFVEKSRYNKIPAISTKQRKSRIFEKLKARATKLAAEAAKIAAANQVEVPTAADFKKDGEAADADADADASSGSDSD